MASWSGLNDDTAAQLYAYGRQQVDVYQARMYEVAEAAAREAGLTLPFGSREEKNAGVRAVMESLGKDSPRSDDELLRWYVDTGRRAVAYGRERQLFDIPADYRLDVVDTGGEVFTVQHEGPAWWPADGATGPVLPGSFTAEAAARVGGVGPLRRRPRGRRPAIEGWSG